LDLVYQNELGVKLVDTALSEAPLLVISVESGSPAALAGLKPGDALASVDGATMTSAEVADRVRQRKPGEVLRITIGGPGAAANQLAIPVQRRPRLAPVFEPTMFGNAITAKLQAAAAVATTSAERDLLGANLALVHMRFGQWRRALEVFGALGPGAAGVGIGPDAVLYFRARCHEELGERDRALALYRDAAASGTQVLADDGATVATLATLRLAALTPAPATAPRLP
jgi:membrane-associated protease RseP (regulator of RpoE activity)